MRLSGLAENTGWGKVGQRRGTIWLHVFSQPNKPAQNNPERLSMEEEPAVTIHRAGSTRYDTTTIVNAPLLRMRPISAHVVGGCEMRRWRVHRRVLRSGSAKAIKSSQQALFCEAAKQTSLILKLAILVCGVADFSMMGSHAAAIDKPCRVEYTMLTNPRSHSPSRYSRVSREVYERARPRRRHAVAIHRLRNVPPAKDTL